MQQWMWTLLYGSIYRYLCSFGQFSMMFAFLLFSPKVLKPGQCPKPKNIPLCAESCFHDGQCPATQKCCPTTSGRQNRPKSPLVFLFLVEFNSCFIPPAYKQQQQYFDGLII
uniref:WAP domain-containing protein n=1 Tax=Sinocyclocheilus anshuiensis TaxID=1608454 RepID=A0A671PPB1_9TELE